MVTRYPGSKGKVARDLWSLRPPHVAEYREPFCGNASMLWVVPTSIPRWINDLNPAMVRLLQSLKTYSFHRRMKEWTAPVRNADDVVTRFDKAKVRWVLEDDPAAYLYLSRHALGQFIMKDRSNIASCGYHYLRDGTRPLAPDRLLRAKRILRGVKITCGQYYHLLDAPGNDVWILIDPPYPAKGRLYAHDMTTAEHHELRDRLLVCPHKFLMTMGDCGLTHKLYCRGDRFNVSFMRYRYSGIRRAIQPSDWEMIIRNY